MCVRGVGNSVQQESAISTSENSTQLTVIREKKHIHTQKTHTHTPTHPFVFNDTFSNISAISWRSVLVVEEAGVPGENHRPWESNW